MAVERFRGKQIKIWTSQKEKAQLEKNLRQSGYQIMEQYLLKIGLEGVSVNVDFSEIRGVLGELGSLRTAFNQIGNNINQIAKHTNENQEIDAIDFYILQKEVEKSRR